MNVEDTLAIQDLIARYAVAVDNRDWDALDGLFVTDARIDFTTFGGPVGDLETTKKFLADTLPGFKRTQHLMGLPVIDVASDRATARTPCSNPMVLGGGEVWLIGLWYDDEFVRTPDGWRFTARVQDRCYSVLGLTDTPLGPA